MVLGLCDRGYGQARGELADSVVNVNSVHSSMQRVGDGGASGSRQSQEPSGGRQVSVPTGIISPADRLRARGLRGGRERSASRQAVPDSARVERSAGRHGN